jgi:hypothetical protein
MSRISPIVSSTCPGSLAYHTIYGQVIDEKGNCVDGASVLIESAMDRRHIMSSRDGSFFSDIRVNGSFDEIRIHVSHCLLCGMETIHAHSDHMAVAVVIRNMRS